MKTVVYNIKGEKKGETELPKLFDSKIREDIAAKLFESDKFLNMQFYSHDPEAGRKHSASGTISHRRHEWKGHYGKGIARVPRKTMWRRGTQFFWVGAEITSARGGRRVHGPKPNRIRKINRKEMEMALYSAYAATANKEMIARRYSSLNDIKHNFNVPVVIESKLDKIKMKDFIEMLRKVYGEAFLLILKRKKIRAGKGKTRGRKYKSNAGLLLVKADKEQVKISGIDVKSVKEIRIEDLYPLGRITMYTENALKELAGVKEAKK